MQPGHDRWTDSRIDDTVARLNERINDAFNEIRVNRDMPKAVAEMAIQMKYIGDGIRACLESQEKLDERFEAYVKDQDTLRRTWVRWAVGSVLAAAGLVLTAIGLLVGKF